MNLKSLLKQIDALGTLKLYTMSYYRKHCGKHCAVPTELDMEDLQELGAHFVDEYYQEDTSEFILVSMRGLLVKDPPRQFGIHLGRRRKRLFTINFVKGKPMIAYWSGDSYKYIDLTTVENSWIDGSTFYLDSYLGDRHSRTWVLTADTPKEAQQWIDSINSHIEYYYRNKKSGRPVSL